MFGIEDEGWIYLRMTRQSEVIPVGVPRKPLITINADVVTNTMRANVSCASSGSRRIKTETQCSTDVGTHVVFDATISGFSSNAYGIPAGRA